jgi:ribosomal-protein-alanine N-acetyltransferase
VILRQPTAADRAGFIAMARASRRLHHPWVAPPTTAAAFDRYLEAGRRPDAALLFVCLRDGGALAGVYNIGHIIRGPLESAFLGYYAAAAHAGQGYMRQGLELVLRHAFSRLKLHRLEANIQPENERSIALVARCGFRKEGLSPRYLKIGGRWRDHERWAILAEEWRGRRRSRARGGS